MNSIDRVGGGARAESPDYQNPDPAAGAFDVALMCAMGPRPPAPRHEESKPAAEGGESSQSREHDVRRTDETKPAETAPAKPVREPLAGSEQPATGKVALPVGFEALATKLPARPVPQAPIEGEAGSQQAVPATLVSAIARAATASADAANPALAWKPTDAERDAAAKLAGEPPLGLQVSHLEVHDQAVPFTPKAPVLEVDPRAAVLNAGPPVAVVAPPADEATRRGRKSNLPVVDASADAGPPRPVKEVVVVPASDPPRPVREFVRTSLPTPARDLAYDNGEARRVPDRPQAPTSAETEAAAARHATRHARPKASDDAAPAPPAPATAQPAAEANAAQASVTSPTRTAQAIAADAEAAATASTAPTTDTAQPRPSDRITFELPGESGIEGRVRLAVRGESVRATLLAAHPEAVGRLERDLGDLQRALREHGFTNTHVSVKEIGRGAGAERSDGPADDSRDREPRSRTSDPREQHDARSRRRPSRDTQGGDR